MNRYKTYRGLIFKLGLKVTLGIPYSSTKNIKYLYFFKEEIILINIEFSSYLNPLILKNGIYPIR